MPNSYEYSYQHDLDNVIDASDAVLAIGTEKVNTTTLKDRSLNGNDATIHGAMPSSGYFLGRRFHDGNNYLDCGNSTPTNSSKFIFNTLIKPVSTGDYLGLIGRGGWDDNYWIAINGNGNTLFYLFGVYNWVLSGQTQLFDGACHLITFTYDSTGAADNMCIYIDGVKTSITKTGNINITAVQSISIGDVTSNYYEYKGIIFYSVLRYIEWEQLNENEFFNTIARLPIYSHNFERYPNSDTSLTTVFPYTSGIITSGSFNKTDGLKCTSAGQIIFSNSFEFDGSEYITLIIGGVEYSGTTTVTQGTITATIAQGSNDITIDMGTGDVLPDIRVQFREEV